MAHSALSLIAANRESWLPYTKQLEQDTSNIVQILK